MARTKGRISARVEAVFRDAPDEQITIKTLVAKTMCNATQISAAITYLRTKYRQTDGAAGLPIETIERAHKWVYRADSLSANGLRRLAKRLGSEEGAKLAAEVQVPDWSQAESGERRRLDARKILSGTLKEELPTLRGAPLHIKTQFAPVPDTEPVVTLKVLGTLQETGEVLVQGSNEQGFESGVWAMRRFV